MEIEIGLERVKGIEPSYAAWEATVLPLNYTRLFVSGEDGGHITFISQRHDKKMQGRGLSKFLIYGYLIPFLDQD